MSLSFLVSALKSCADKVAIFVINKIACVNDPTRESLVGADANKDKCDRAMVCLFGR